ncbi:MAG: hypothetical protein ACXWDT_06675 [Solirubrobacterales bacterium]
MSDGTESLQQTADRLQALAGRLAAEQDDERLADLVREASKLAAEAGEQVDRALRQPPPDS